MPKTLQLYRNKTGHLATKIPDDHGGLKEIVLFVAKCFPWSQPDGFISLRDKKGREIAFVERLDEFGDEQTRRLIEEELQERLFLPRIEKIDALDDQIDLFRWKVKTDAGARIFYTRRREIPRELSIGGVIIKDIAGDCYYIPEPENLDSRSRELLWMYLD